MSTTHEVRTMMLTTENKRNIASIVRSLIGSARLAEDEDWEGVRLLMEDAAERCHPAEFWIAAVTMIRDLTTGIAHYQGESREDLLATFAERAATAEARWYSE